MLLEGQGRALTLISLRFPFSNLTGELQATNVRKITNRGAGISEVRMLELLLTITVSPYFRGGCEGFEKKTKDFRGVNR